MITHIQRVEPEFSARGEGIHVVLWRDVSAALERLVFGDQRLASPTDRLCAMYLTGSDPACAPALEELGAVSNGVGASPVWARRLPELLRGLDALDDTARVFSGPRTLALSHLQSAIQTCLLAAGARDRGAGTGVLLERASRLFESELRAILQADGALVFVDPFGLSPVEWALVDRAKTLLCEVQIEFPLPDLPLNAERPRDPLEAALAWGELCAGEALHVALLPRAWGRERGALSPEVSSSTSLRAWSLSSVFEQVEWAVRDMLLRLGGGESCDSIMVVCADATRRRELLASMQTACIPALCRSESGAAFEGYFRALLAVFKHVHAPFPSPVWEGLSTLLMQGPHPRHRRAGEWLAAQRVYVPRVWQLVGLDSAPDTLCAVARALEHVSSAGNWGAMFGAAREVIAALGAEHAWGEALAATLARHDGTGGGRGVEPEPALGATYASSQADVAARARASRIALDALSELERSLHRLGGMQSTPSSELLAVALAAAEKNGAPASRAAGVAAVRVLSSVAEAPVGARVVYLLDMTDDAFPGRGTDAPLGLDENETSVRERHTQQRWAAYANLARITEHAECTMALVPLTGEGREVLEAASGLHPQSAVTPCAADSVPGDVLVRAAREDGRRRMAGDDSVLGSVQSEAHLALLAEATGLSRPLPVTRLERFVTCVYQGYVASVLRGREIDRKPWMADARELGSTRHEALHVVFDAVRSELEREQPDAALVVARARVAFAEWTAGLAAQGRGLVDSVDREAVWAMVLRALRMALADSEYVYSAGEVGFGGNTDERPALVLPLATGPLHLMGRIDRVDMLRADKTRLRVVDYKSGTTKPSVREVGTRMLQAPLYALSLAADNEAPRHAWAYLYPRVGEQVDSRSLSKDESQTGERQDRISLSLATSVASVERVRGGNISPNPLDGACAQCEAAGVCRYDAAQAAAEEEVES